MKGMTSRQKILLGFGTFSTTSDPNAYMGIRAKDAGLIYGIR